jgi:polysaccharide export outer membrane protein
MSFKLHIAFVVLGLALLAQPQAMAQSSDASKGYLLGPDDAIIVTVYGQPEAGIQTRIKADGTVVMPLIGTVKAEGQTNVSLAKLITDKLVQGNYLRSPVVNVEITGYVSKAANVAGQVNTPGIYPLDRPYRALDVLLKAGWVRATGANYVFLRRTGQPELRLETESLVRGGDAENPLLQDGDTLFVPDADMFYIYGQINQPGMRPILPGMTIRQALASAGGVTPNGKSDKVGLVRGKAKEIDVDVAQTVQKGDVIVVKERLF